MTIARKLGEMKIPRNEEAVPMRGKISFVADPWEGDDKDINL